MAAAKGRYFYFEDPGVQAEFIRALDRAAVAYRCGDDGEVVFDALNAMAVMKAVNRVRDAQFPWYLLNWKTEAEADRYRDILIAEGLTFIAERQDTGLWFLVKREDRSRHDELWAHITNLPLISPLRPSVPSSLRRRRRPVGGVYEDILE